MRYSLIKPSLEMRKTLFIALTYLTLLLSCSSDPKNEITPDPCYLYKAYVDTLNTFVSDLLFYKEEFDPKYYDKDVNLQRFPDRIDYKNYDYFIRNHEKWDWLPHPLNRNRIEIRLNIESLIDSLKKYKCSTGRSIDFAYDAINKIKSDEKKEDEYEDLSISQGKDFNLKGISITQSDILYDENFNPKVECQIENKTEITFKSIQVYVKFCNDVMPGSHIKLTQDCYDLININEVFKPSASYKFTASLNKQKTERSTQRIVVKVLRVVKDNGELIETLDVPFF